MTVKTMPEVDVPEEMDEAERLEIEAAHKMAAETELKEKESEPEEIAGLRAAFQKIEEKIGWYEQQIAAKETEIQGHRQQIVELRELVKKKFKLLTDEQTFPTRGPGRPKGSGKKGAKARISYGDGNSTGDLIASCLKSAKAPLDTKTIIGFLKNQGNDTNPSVELSRMVNKGLVERPSRGLYQWIAANE